jgi:hypothetical protein
MSIIGNRARHAACIAFAGAAAAFVACVSSNNPGSTSSDGGSNPLGSDDASLDGGAPHDSAVATDSPAPTGEGGCAVDAGGATCTFVVTGASTGCGPCVVTMDYNSPGAGLPTQMEFFLNNQGLAASSAIQVEIVVYDNDPALDAGTYTIDTAFSSDGHWTAGQGAWFEQSAPALGKQGSFTLVLSSVDELATYDAGNVLATYAVHGTLTEVLPDNEADEPAEAGAITVQATF